VAEVALERLINVKGESRAMRVQGIVVVSPLGRQIDSGRLVGVRSDVFENRLGQQTTGSSARRSRFAGRG
jgi:hypothetical protein